MSRIRGSVGLALQTSFVKAAVTIRDEYVVWGIEEDACPRQVLVGRV
jgi:hypothetical protein